MEEVKELSKEEWDKKKDEILSHLKGLTISQAISLIDYSKARLEVEIKNLIL